MRELDNIKSESSTKVVLPSRCRLDRLKGLGLVAHDVQQKANGAGCSLNRVYSAIFPARVAGWLACQFRPPAIDWSSSR